MGGRGIPPTGEEVVEILLRTIQVSLQVLNRSEEIIAGRLIPLVLDRQTERLLGLVKHPPGQVDPALQITYPPVVRCPPLQFVSVGLRFLHPVQLQQQLCTFQQVGGIVHAVFDRLPIVLQGSIRFLLKSVQIPLVTPRWPECRIHSQRLVYISQCRIQIPVGNSDTSQARQCPCRIRIDLQRIIEPARGLANISLGQIGRSLDCEEFRLGLRGGKTTGIESQHLPCLLLQEQRPGQQRKNRIVAHSQFFRPTQFLFRCGTVSNLGIQSPKQPSGLGIPRILRQRILQLDGSGAQLASVQIVLRPGHVLGIRHAAKAVTAGEKQNQDECQYPLHIVISFA